MLSCARVVGCATINDPFLTPYFSLAFLLTIYLLTLAPTITWAHHGADGGDLVTAVARGSIPHPPGFPAYLLLGELFIRLPWGDPAWRLNLMSAVLAAAAACLTAAATRFLLPLATHNPPLTICTGLSLGLAPLFWSQALIAEVYAPAAFFTALVVYLSLKGGPAWALGLAWGVGLGVHPTLLFLAPLVWGKPGLFRKTWFPALLGCGAMYGPVLLARSAVASPWGEVNTFEGWWTLVSGEMYRGYLLGLPPTAWPQRLLAWVGLLARQFTPVGAMLAGLGWVCLRRERRSSSLATASTLAFGAFSLYAISYDTTDSLVYLAPALPVAALWMGAGLTQAADWLARRWRRGAWILLLLPLLQASLFWGRMDLSGDRTAMEWAEQVLGEAPPQAVILTDQDAHTFTLWYAHDVLGRRPDIAVIDVDLWGREPYRRITAGALGLEAIESDLSPEEAANRAGRPVVRMNNE